jgi:hypothetical protein
VSSTRNVDFLSADGGLTFVRDPNSEAGITPRSVVGRPLSIKQAQTGLVVSELGYGGGPIEKRVEMHDVLWSQSDWIAGTHGIILRRAFSAIHWVPLTRSAAPDGYSGPYTRFLPPWYWLALGLCGLLMLPFLAPSVTEIKGQDFQLPPALGTGLEKGSSDLPPRERAPAVAPVSGIGNQAISDRPLEPGDPDALGLGAIAAGLAFFLRNDKTRPPLVLAINGRWGSGKSSLMNLLKKELQDSGTCPVWFNAWHHQKESQLLAALLQAVRAQAIPALSTWRGWAFRGRLAWTRLRKYWFRLAALAGIIFLLYRVEIFLVHNTSFNLGSLLNFVFNPDQSALKNLADFLKNNPVISIIPPPCSPPVPAAARKKSWTRRPASA